MKVEKDRKSSYDEPCGNKRKEKFKRDERKETKAKIFESKEGHIADIYPNHQRHIEQNKLLVATDYKCIRRKSETPAYRYKENENSEKSFECKKNSQSCESIENAENSASSLESCHKDRQAIDGDEYLICKSTQKSEIHKAPTEDLKIVQRSKCQHSSELSPKKLSYNLAHQTHSSLLIPETKLSRRKSETPSYNFQKDEPATLPFLRRQSVAPTTPVMRTSHSPPADQESEDENKKQSIPSLVFPDHEIGNTISVSLNRLAIGKITSYQ